MQTMRNLLARVAPSLTGLAGLALFCGLWCGGAHGVYNQLLNAWGVQPGRFPFLDLQSNLAAWDCARKGVDVIQADPCDVLLGGYNYSPFWMSIDWISLGRPELGWAGLVLGTTFLCSLAALPPPLSRTETLVRVACVLSMTAVFAVERANLDLLIFLLVLIVLFLLHRSPIVRGFGYAVAFIAGAIKYYPFVLFGLAARERPRILFPFAAAVLVGLAAFYHHYAAQIREGLPKIPHGSVFGNMFGLINLPGGTFILLETFKVAPATAAAAGLILGVLLAAAMAWIMNRIWLGSDFRAVVRGLDEPRRLALLAGALLLAGCFVTGQNVAYRGIFLFLILPGLFAIGHNPSAGAAAPAARLAAATIAPLMWSPALRNWVHLAITGHFPPPHYVMVPVLPLDILVWSLRETAWWLLTAYLITILLAFLLDCPLFKLRRSSPAGAASSPPKA